ncbi:MAG: permease-like cell division protein FtsX [Bacteroidota bacterium]
MALSYTLREGIAGFKRAKLSSATSVFALALALVLIGMFVLIGWLVSEAAEGVRESISEVEVYLEAIDTAAATRVGERLETIPGVDSLRFVSHEEAAEIFRESFGEGADLYDDAQFLPASWRVRLVGAYASADSLAKFVTTVEAWGSVEAVDYEEELLVKVERNARMLSVAGLAIVALVVLAALLLVGNTVRLSIYARRMLIRTMKLVGATNAFIRRPFLVEGVVHGLLAGLGAGVTLWALYGLLLRLLGSSDVAVPGSGWPGGSPMYVLGGLVLVGLVLGWMASWVAVRRFIREVRLS